MADGWIAKVSQNLDFDFKYSNWPDAFWLTLRLKTKENRNSDNYFRSIQRVFESNTNWLDIRQNPDAQFPVLENVESKGRVSSSDLVQTVRAF